LTTAQRVIEKRPVGRSEEAESKDKAEADLKTEYWVHRRNPGNTLQFFKSLENPDLEDET